MNRFRSIGEAQEYLVSRIVAQAERDGIALSEVERRMLYFSETCWTLPDMMAVSREFDDSYDQDEYEAKIGGIVGRIRDEGDGGHADEDWERAVALLAREDHYLLVLIAAGNRAPEATRRWGIGRLILAGVVGAVVGFAFFLYVDSHIQNRIVSALLINGGILALVVLVMRVGNRGSGRSS